MKTLEDIHHRLKVCRACPRMCGTPVYGQTKMAQIMLIGQAPGPHEALRGKPFAFTAGRTLFNWLHQISPLAEDDLRERICFSAVARCFPGKKTPGGGDREPDLEEMANCRKFLVAEVKVLKPKLIIAVGKLAISEVLGPAVFKKSSPLSTVIGKKFFVNYHGHPVPVIPLPHPSGISTWHKRGSGKMLLQAALQLIADEAKRSDLPIFG